MKLAYISNLKQLITVLGAVIRNGPAVQGRKSKSWEEPSDVILQACVWCIELIFLQQF